MPVVSGGNFGGRDAAVEPAGKYLRRFLEEITGIGAWAIMKPSKVSAIRIRVDWFSKRDHSVQTTISGHLTYLIAGRLLMKNLLIIVCLGFAAYKGWEHFNSSPSIEPLMETPYVAVYGRDSCGFTQKTLKELNGKGIDYTYYKIDETSVAELLHARMRASDISTSRYQLPVVDVNGVIMLRPDTTTIVQNYGTNLWFFELLIIARTKVRSLDRV
jgi:glutaredoxin